MAHPEVYVSFCPFGCGNTLLQSELAEHLDRHKETAARQTGQRAVEEAMGLAERLLVEYVWGLSLTPVSSLPSPCHTTP